MQPEQLTDLKTFWASVLGEPLPSDANFAVWAELHTYETIHHGILKTGMKNLSLNETMSQDHKVRFASKVMIQKTNDPQKAEGQRPRTPEATEAAKGVA